jgi:hypothetical protein
MIISTDINSVLQKIKETTPKIVGIDGIDGVGKTTLAKDIETLSYKRISVDEYLNKKSGGYFEFLDFKRLKKELASNEKFVIEGVLLCKILNALNVKTNYLIYTTDNIWLDDWSEEYEGKYLTMSLEDIIRTEEEAVNRLNKAISPNSKKYKMQGLRREIYEYSFEYRPWLDADIIIKKNLKL